MRILGKFAAALVAAVLLLVAAVYGGSEWIIRTGHTVPSEPVTAPTDVASLAEGARLARIFGCRDCHSPDGTGSIMVESPVFARLAPPALARVAATYSDADLARAVRHGVRKDGTTLWIMPTHAHAFIADDDMARVITWIRTLKPSDKDQFRKTSFGPMGRALILFGALKPSAHPGSVAAKTRPADIGRYFVDASCTGCHALDREQPSEDGNQIVPALAPVAASYGFAAFKKLLQTGVGMSKRDLGMMRTAALGAYSGSLTDAEMQSIHDYLKREAAKQAQ